MRIEPNNSIKKFFEKKCWRDARKTLIKCRSGVVDFAQHTDPERLKDQVHRLMDSAPMKKYVEDLWSEVGGRFACDTERILQKRKSGYVEMEVKKQNEQLSLWQDHMRAYSAERSLQKVAAIMTTEEEAINTVIDKVIKTSLDEGLGIQKTRELLKSSLEGDDMIEIENWQAQRIAMTEVGSASNTGSFEAAQENNEGVKKIWMFIPGLKTFRENHQGFEAMGPQEMDYEFAPGLQYPGDENGDAEEVINCYCSIGYEVD